MAGANPVVDTTRLSRGTRIESCDFIVLIGDLWFFLFVLVCSVSRVSGSDGLYLSTLSDMSPATSDCLGPYFSVFFPIIAFVLTFLGSFNSCIFHIK